MAAGRGVGPVSGREPEGGESPLGLWVDGAAGAEIPVTDRGLQYGDGLFETIAAADGRLRFEALHWERLARGCARLGIAAPDWRALRSEALQAAAGDRFVVKVIVTRGSGGRGYAPGGAGPARRIVLRYRWPEERVDVGERGVAVEWSDVALAAQPALAGLKHLNRLEQVMGRARVGASGVDEALMCTEDGQVICGTMSNVFIVRQGRLLTPRVDRAGVAGVIRAVVLRDAAVLGLAAAETSLQRTDFASADEVFVTNARIGVWPVRRLGATRYAVGPFAQRLRAHLASVST
jgi:4-amino-4-deoxychorismate lyase